jgi:hypothetical protein
MRNFVSAIALLLGVACVKLDNVNQPQVLVTEPPPAPPASCPGYADPDHCPPFATGGPYSISGVVSLRTATGVGPSAKARVGGYVFMTTGNAYSMGYATADSTGRYKFSQVPEGFVVLFAGFDQPCAATANVKGDVTRNIELVTPGVQPGAATESSVVSGMVYRQTSTGRQLISGARVELELVANLITASVTTDAGGRYRLCAIPPGGRPSIYVLVDGKLAKALSVDVNGDTQLDIAIP